MGAVFVVGRGKGKKNTRVVCGVGSVGNRREGLLDARTFVAMSRRVLLLFSRFEEKIAR